MSYVYFLDPSSLLITHILTNGKASIGNTNFNPSSSPYTLNVQGVTCSNNVSAFQIPADTSNNRPSGQRGYIRYNTDTGSNVIEYWSGLTNSWTAISTQSPAIASITPTYVTDASYTADVTVNGANLTGTNVINITGSNFVATPNVFLINKNNVLTSSGPVKFVSSSSLITTVPASLLTVSAELLGPYSVQVTNTGSGLSATSVNAISVNLVPYWSPGNSLGAPTSLGPVDGSTNLTKASNIRCIAIDPEGTSITYTLTNDTSQNLVPANVTLDPSGYLISTSISTSTTKVSSSTSYSFKVDAVDSGVGPVHSSIGYFTFSLNAYQSLLSFSSLSGLTVSIGYVDNNGANYTTTGPYRTSPPGYTIYTIQCTNSTGTGVTGTGTVTYPAGTFCPTYLTYFIVGGGGGGGGNQAGGGGGAGGLLYNPCYAISASGTASIQVGQGGAGGLDPAGTGSNGGSGTASFLGANSATGGGGGAAMIVTTPSSTSINPGLAGGSGGGGSNWTAYGVNAAGGAGTNSLTITSQGNAGGSSNNISTTTGHSTGGGGGYAGPGINAYPQSPGGTTTTNFATMNGGHGANGLTTNITGSQLQVAGGGGGGCFYGIAGNGGVGGGGYGFSNNNGGTGTTGSAGAPATTRNGAPNTGGGGGGGGLGGGGGAGQFTAPAGTGGCGIIILRHISYITTATLNTWSITSSSNITTTTIYLNNAGSVVGSAVNGGYTVLVFTSPVTTTGTCTFTPTTNIGPNVSYLVCGGGGSGGQGSGGGAGGGGGGGVLIGAAYPVTINTGYSITIGRGGLAVNGAGPGNNTGTNQQGANSIFGTITAYGGGGGGSGTSNGASGGPSPGGCGGGGGEWPNLPGAAGTIGQGYAGGSTVGLGQAAGGGGASGPGSYSTASLVGAGGPGLPSTITGTLVYYGGGGGASGNSLPGSSGGLCGPSPYTSAGNGGPGSGGSGTPTSAAAGYGGGGGGTYQTGAGTLTGGSGTVILRFPSYTLS